MARVLLPLCCPYFLRNGIFPASKIHCENARSGSCEHHGSDYFLGMRAAENFEVPQRGTCKRK
jgi:hypothetical protein